MKFDLKDYQEEAVTKVLAGLRKGSAGFADDGEHAAVSLSAPTGAGKTVIAAAVIERILFGDPEGDSEADPRAVFLWLTDDPSLNEQTRKKLLEASDRLQSSNLITLDDTFDQAEFSYGKVYFLNVQKLRKGANFTLRKEGRRKNVLWDTITRSIKDNGAHHYLVIDEAHRGTGRRSSDDQTITQRLTHGNGLVVGAPVVLGISATPERFEAAVKAGAQDRVLRKVSVPVAAVRESGLIKDVLSVSYRGEMQTMETTLVRQAAATLKVVNDSWNAYCEAEGEPAVRPALVLQIPPNLSSDDVGTLLDVCVEEWSELGGRNSMAHSLESHTAMEFGDHVLHYVKPQNIQDHPGIRLVVFKEALTTGWDCPRAEVMVSLRVAKDSTYIAQLIGRMVRSPLARRIESDEALNRVRLYLPNFDRVAVEAVRAKLEGEEGGLPSDVEIDAVDVPRNSGVPAEAFVSIQSIPSYVVPGPVHRSQVARLHKLAALLIGDGLFPKAIAAADSFLVDILNAERSRLDEEGKLNGLLLSARTATVETIDIDAIGTGEIYTEMYETDVADVDRVFVRSRRKLKDGLADRYWASRVSQHDEDSYVAKVLTIALSLDNGVVNKVETEAADRVRQWLDSYGDEIATLSDDKKARYSEVRAMARDPELTSLVLPDGTITMSGDTAIDSYSKHLYSDDLGLYRARLGSWEKYVLSVESARQNFVGWYRNPTGGQRALRIPYKTTSGYGKLYPDLIVLNSEEDGSIRPSIIDPHGHYLGDAADKLRGLAAYAKSHVDVVARVSAVIKNSDGLFRILDLKDETIRQALKSVRTRSDIEQVFAAHGAMYL